MGQEPAARIGLGPEVTMTSPKVTIGQLKERVAAFPYRQNVVFQGVRGSVLVPLVLRAVEDTSLDPHVDISVLLTVRSSKLRTHGGEVSFPGGKQDETDANEVETALRETFEEIGIAPSSVDVLGRLDQAMSKHLLLVTPVIGIVREPYETKLNPSEVDELFSVPLDMFLRDDDRHTQTDIDFGAPMRMHSFSFEGYRIWGLTANVLVQAAALIYATEPEFVADVPDMPTPNDLANIFDTEWRLPAWFTNKSSVATSSTLSSSL